MQTSRILTLDTYITTALARTGLSAQERAVIDNLRMEERVGDARLNRYGEVFRGKSVVTSVDDLYGLQRNYAIQYLEIDPSEADIPIPLPPTTQPMLGVISTTGCICCGWRTLVSR